MKDQNLFGVFVPDGQKYKKLTDGFTIKSVNSVAEHLGYHKTQVHSYWGELNEGGVISSIAFEVFTDNIIFVLAEDTLSKISQDLIALSFCLTSNTRLLVSKSLRITV